MYSFYNTDVCFYTWLVYLFTVVFIILYIIAISQSSVLELSFYGVLSVLPTVAITAVTWVLKTKIFSDNNEDNDRQERYGDNNP